MTLDQWLLRFDPANLSVTVLVFIVLVTAILFVWTKFWPWYITQAWPARQKMDQTRLEIEAHQEQSRLEVMTGIRDTLIELKVLVGQNQKTTFLIAEQLSQQQPYTPVSKAARKRTPSNEVEI